MYLLYDKYYFNLFTEIDKWYAGAADTSSFPNTNWTSVYCDYIAMGERAEHAALFANGVPSGTFKIIPEGVSLITKHSTRALLITLLITTAL